MRKNKIELSPFEKMLEQFKKESKERQRDYKKYQDKLIKVRPKKKVENDKEKE